VGYTKAVISGDTLEIYEFEKDLPKAKRNKPNHILKE